MSNITKDWALYEAGKKYNNRLTPSYYDTVDANIAFFNGDQWRNVSAENMPKPVFNIIKRVITFFVASLTSSKAKIHYEPLQMADNSSSPDMEIADIANAQTDTLFDKFKMEFKVRDAAFDAAITGDACAHFYFDTTKRPYNYAEGIKGEICMELVDGSNVFFGNANNPKTDIQPYIIISGRDMVKNLQEEAKRHKTGDADGVTSDVQYGEQSGDAGKIEVEADEYGKALYIIVYRKKKVKKETGVDEDTGEPIYEEVEIVHASKSVENAYIYQDIDTGLSEYPVAWLNWEKQKNQYHGKALCSAIMPNQIFINRMFAMVMYHLMMTAFPKAVYNADLLDTWDNDIGAAVPVSGLGGDMSINNIAGYLNPSNMSNQIVQAIELTMQYTKETIGVSDAALGQIDPKNTSAIIAVQKSTAIPLENVRANIYEWVEDIGKILFDMMGTYYGLRPIVYEKEGQKVMQMFDFSIFKDTWLDVSADVGETSYWSEIASMQTLDNLLQAGHIDIIQYLERVPEEYIPQKQEIISELKQRMGMTEQDQPPNIDQIISQLSEEEQQRFAQAPPEVQQQIIAQMQQPQMGGV